MSRWNFLASILVVLAIGPSTRAQGVGEIAPPAKLGLRAETIRGATTARNTVVIVPDADSYLEAIAHWRSTERFPVLIDDGTVHVRQNIARFVRGYEPKRVVRWHAVAARPLETNPARQNAIEGSLLRSWGYTDEQSLADLYAFWRGKDQFAPGIVVAHPSDPAWTAALALASFRAQPIVWALTPRNVNGQLQREQADELVSAIESGCDALGFAYEDLGDQIDAVALCLQTPAKYKHTDSEIRAITDRIGRHADDQEGERRWAFCSQIFGSEADAAYRAMCGLFLSPRTAMLFDGYKNEPPWSNYELGSLEQMLKDLGATYRSYAVPRNGRDQWLISAGRAVDAGLIFVNTHGMRDAFNLSPGRLRPGALPVLEVPAMIHFVHSWSSVRPNDRSTVAGRWFERGVHAFYGSVNEPYLQAFCPPSLVMRRMRGAFPWATAVRVQRSPVWKLATFGDPLITLGSPLVRSDDPVGLEGAVDIASQVGVAAKESRFAEAFDHLSLLGRDQDALRLMQALVRERPQSVTPKVARSAVFAIGRAGTPSEFFDCYKRLDAPTAHDAYLLDHLWNLMRLRLNVPSANDRALISFLRSHLREDQRFEDAADLSQAIAKLDGTSAASRFLDSLNATRPRDREVLKAAKQRLIGR